MRGPEIFTITEFARLSRTTRRTLLHYDDIGVLQPMSRGENNYRFYSGQQLGILNIVRTCQEMGMPLSEINTYKDNRSPENVTKLLDKQVESIDAAIDEWQRARKLLTTIKAITDGVKGVDESAVTIERRPAERVIMGRENDYGDGRNDNDALLAFYRDFERSRPDLDLNYPVWGYFDEERIKNRDWKWPSRYYFYNPEGGDVKPEGLYATGYTRGGYGESGGLYERMLAHIEARGFEVCGPAYEEYPLNELTIIEPDHYLMRVSIAVRQKL